VLPVECANCGAQIAKNGLLKLWEQDEVLQRVVSREELRRELAKVHPFVQCFHCDDEDNIFVRADLAEELAHVEDIDGQDETTQPQIYTQFD
jgi:ribosomal protein S27E